MQGKRFAILLLATLVCSACWGCRPEPTVEAAATLAEMTTPTYDDRGNMHRPEGYRRWVFVGSALGLRYVQDGEAEDDGPGSFHNVYIQPEAFDAFMDDGVFPEKTILAMETYTAGTREPKSELTGGFFEDQFDGFSVAVKDSERFPESWGYVTFGDGDTAAPFPRERCHDCHATHGAIDNVFTQFYPILRR